MIESKGIKAGAVPKCFSCLVAGCGCGVVVGFISEVEVE